MPIEFTRQSSDGRMTLIIEPAAASLKVLWALMVPRDLAVAASALCKRKGIADKNCSSGIGSWKSGDSAPRDIADMPLWAEAHEVDAVVWTALGPRFNSNARSPSADAVIRYLDGLREPFRTRARQYIERAPRQIDTNYRRQIEAVLGWASSAGE